MANNLGYTEGSGDSVVTKERATDVHTQVVALPAAIVTATSAGLTTATTAYVTGDMIGTEWSWAGAVAALTSGTDTSTLISATLVDKAKVLTVCDLFLFDRSVTQAADNAANSWSDADMLNLLGVITFGGAMVSALNHVLIGVNGIPLKLQPNSGTTIYGGLVTRAGHTFFGAAGDVQIKLGFDHD